MTDDISITTSKQLSRWLRHRPDAIDLRLDKQGWADVDEFLTKAATAGVELTYAQLLQVVITNDKQRFALSPDGKRIRAAQGHSVSVDIAAPIKKPPPVLYHGTVSKFLDSIRRQGLIPGTRQDVHLSATRETADAVGRRRGYPVVLTIDTHPLIRDGFKFRQAENGVWLISHVPAKYLRFP